MRVIGSWGRVKDGNLATKIERRNVYGPEMSELAASSRLCINILRLQNEGSHNMRTFETPGSGGLSFSQFSDEQNGFFPEDEAALYVRRREDLRAIILAAFDSPDKLANMRSNASELVLNHTYTQRARTLLGALL
jgi:spore maturation protein CgeB